MIQEHSEKRATIRCDRAGCSRSLTVRLKPEKAGGIVAQCCVTAVASGWTVSEDPDRPDVCVGCNNNDWIDAYERERAANVQTGGES